MRSFGPESIKSPDKVTWKTVTASRLDTAALRKAIPDVAAAFTRTTTTRRFCVA